MSFLDEVELASGDLPRPHTAVLGALQKHLKSDPKQLFEELRGKKPIFVKHGIAIVTYFEDVIEVLQQSAVFNVLYRPKMQAVGGDFILGLDNNAQYEKDLSILRLAVRREDIQQIIRPAIERLTREIIDTARGRGELEVVGGLTKRLPARLIATYLGVPGPDEDTLIKWAHFLFDDIFNNLHNDLAIENRALAAGKEMCAYLDDLIETRRNELKNGNGQDDVLGRLLKMQGSGLSIEDLWIRNNLIGLIVGWIPTVSKSIAMALNFLLDRQELKAAKKAASANNIELVRAAMFESMRFAPQNPGLLRLCVSDYIVAKGTSRAATIPKRSLVFAATQSAMMDDRIIDKPDLFLLDRPLYHYLHFGSGLHTCFAQYINSEQIPLIAQALLSLPALTRAPGQSGVLSFQGNFPCSMTVRI